MGSCADTYNNVCTYQSRKLKSFLRSKGSFSIYDVRFLIEYVDVLTGRCSGTCLSLVYTSLPPWLAVIPGRAPSPLGEAGLLDVVVEPRRRLHLGFRGLGFRALELNGDNTKAKKPNRI